MGETIVVTFRKQDVSAPFRAFVAEESRQGRVLGVDELLILQFLLRHTELETTHAAALCQRTDATMRATLSRTERDCGWLVRGGSGRGTYWMLGRALAKTLRPEAVDRNQVRIDWETAKTRVLSILKQRVEAGEEGLKNSESRSITHFDRFQVRRLMEELRTEHPQLAVTGRGAGARHAWNPK